TPARMLREFCEFAEALGVERPFVLVVEDLHWSDYATINVLSLLARRSNPARLLVLGSTRPPDVPHRIHPPPPVGKELGIAELCSELRLGTLSLSETTSYLTLRLGDTNFDDEMAQAVHRRSDGHPLFLVNLVDYLAAAGKFGSAGGRPTVAASCASADAVLPG